MPRCLVLEETASLSGDPGCALGGSANREVQRYPFPPPRARGLGPAPPPPARKEHRTSERCVFRATNSRHILRK